MSYGRTRQASVPRGGQAIRHRASRNGPWESNPQPGAVADEALRARLRSATLKLEAALGPEAVRGVRDHESTVLMPSLGPRAPDPRSFRSDRAQRPGARFFWTSRAAPWRTTRGALRPLGPARQGPGARPP